MEAAQITCVIDMCTGAEFLGEITHGYDSDRIAVLFIKQGCSTCLLCFFNRQNLGCNRQIFIDLLVDDALYFLELLSRRLFKMREVETAVVRSIVGTCLGNVIAQYLAQSCL